MDAASCERVVEQIVCRLADGRSQAFGSGGREKIGTASSLFRPRVRGWPFVPYICSREPLLFMGSNTQSSALDDAEDTEIAAMDLPAVSTPPAAIPVSPTVGDRCCSHREQARI